MDPQPDDIRRSVSSSRSQRSSKSAKSTKSLKSQKTIQTIAKTLPEKINPIQIKVNKKDLKIPYTKKTPIFANNGFHLERDTENEKDMKYFSKLVATPRNKSATSLKSSPTEPKKLRLDSGVKQPLKSVTIRSQSSENVGILLRKSEMSFKNEDPSRLSISRLESNFDVHSVSDELNPPEFEESVILNIIAKAKCGETMNEEQIENFLSNQLFNLEIFKKIFIFKKI